MPGLGQSRAHGENDIEHGAQQHRGDAEEPARWPRPPRCRRDSSQLGVHENAVSTSPGSWFISRHQRKERSTLRNSAEDNNKKPAAGVPPASPEKTDLCRRGRAQRLSNGTSPGPPNTNACPPPLANAMSPLPVRERNTAMSLSVPVVLARHRGIAATPEDER